MASAPDGAEFMRETLLILIVGVLSLAAILRPQIGLYAYIWFAIMRPDAMAWSSGVPYSLALAAATLAGSFRFLPGARVLLKNPIVVLLLALQAPIVLSAIFARDPSLSWEPLSLYGRVILMSLLIVVLIRTEQELRTLLIAIGVFLGLLGAKFGLYGIVNGGVQLASGNAGFMADNNDLALGLAMGVPLCWHSRALVRSVWAKSGFLLMVFATIAAIIMTHSRGAAVSLAIAFVVISLHSRKRFAVFVLFLLMAAPAIHLVQDTYLPRMATLEAPKEEGSALLRIIYAKGAVAMWLDHPILGVGFGSKNQMLLWHKYMSEAPRSQPQVIHNTYLQMLVDSGTFAFVIYICLLFGTLVFLERSVGRMKREHPGMDIYPAALLASLASFAVGCVFLSRVQFDLAYILLMCAAAWLGIQRQLDSKISNLSAESLAAASETIPIPAEAEAQRPSYAESHPLFREAHRFAS